MVAKAWLLALCLVALPAVAAESPEAVSPRSAVSLVTDVDAYAPGTPFRIGLRIAPAPGWHVYWRNPGDAGAPPDFGEGLPNAGPIAWPLPERIADGPVMSFGYTRPILLARSVLLNRPVALHATGTVTLATRATWLICAKICVPEAATLSLALPAGAPIPSADATAFAAEAARVPRPALTPAFIAPDGTLWFTGLPRIGGPAAFIPDNGATTVLAAPQAPRWRNGVLSLHLTPTAAFHGGGPVSGVLVLGEGADRIGVAVRAVPRALPATVGRFAWGTLLLAAAGGLLLNLMPCVFPVLAMKAMALAALTGQARRTVRAHALSYAAGVLASFLALAVLLLGLRQAGAAVGWGFQLQWPAMVAAMAWLFFAIGLNLSGVFTLGLPGAGAGQALAARGGHAGSFATGILAVLVATPCTAPFMGAAIGAAATAPAAEALAIFAAVAAGFALPPLLLAAAPPLARILPRPGPWMEWLRQALAFPMYAAAVWLTWVLSRQAGPDGVLATGAGFVLVALGVWLLRLGRRPAGFATALCILGAAALLPGIGRATAPPGEPYSSARLAALRAQHQPVLVNMTASWCVTCLVNERMALRPALPGLATRHVAYLVGDWTRPDPQIGAFLHDYARDGVPLYVFFAPDQKPLVLPQLLSPALLNSLS